MMKKLMLMCLVLMFVATAAYGITARYECVRTNTAAGNTFLERVGGFRLPGIGEALDHT